MLHVLKAKSTKSTIYTTVAQNHSIVCEIWHFHIQCRHKSHSPIPGTKHWNTPCCIFAVQVWQTPGCSPFLRKIITTTYTLCHCYVGEKTPRLVITRVKTTYTQPHGTSSRQQDLSEDLRQQDLRPDLRQQDLRPCLPQTTWFSPLCTSSYCMQNITHYYKGDCHLRIREIIYHLI